MNSTSVAGLILAAGESSRMGQDKALLAYQNSTFLENIVGTLREAGLVRILVVFGHHAEEIRKRVDLRGVEVLLNRDFRRGQTSSLQTGLRALAGGSCAGAMVCLVDHPAVSPQTVGALLAAFAESPAPVVIPTYRGQRGHPVLIARALFGEILALEASEGANAVVRRHREAARLVEVEDWGVLLDVDDPQTYRKVAAWDALNPS